MSENRYRERNMLVAQRDSLERACGAYRSRISELEAQLALAKQDAGELVELLEESRDHSEWCKCPDELSDCSTCRFDDKIQAAIAKHGSDDAAKEE